MRGLDDRTLTLRMEKASFREVLNAVCQELDLAYAIINGAVYISTHQRVSELVPPMITRPNWAGEQFYVRYHPNAGQRLHWAMGTTVSVDFANAPLNAVAALIRSRFNIDIRLDPKAPDLQRSGPVTLKLKRQKLKNVLAPLCSTLDLGHFIVDDVLVLSTRRAVSERTAARAALNDERATKHIRAALRKPASFDFLATPLIDAVTFLHSVAGVNFVIDKQVFADDEHQEVTLNLESAGMGDSLAWLLRPVDLRYDVRNGAIFISTKEGLLANRLTRTVFYNAKQWDPLAAAMDKPVSFDAIGETAHKLLKLTSKQTGAEIVFSRRAHSRAHAAEITLRVDKMALKNALAWVCYELDLAYTIADGLILITTPDAVRDEGAPFVAAQFARPKPIWPIEWQQEKNNTPISMATRTGGRRAFTERWLSP